MKKYLLAAVVLAAAATGSAQAQSFSTSVDRDRREPRQRPPAELTRRPVAGAFPRAARGGNPLQMLNPRAPARYRGSVDDTVTYDQQNPSRITGIILFGIRW